MPTKKNNKIPTVATLVARMATRLWWRLWLGRAEFEFWRESEMFNQGVGFCFGAFGRSSHI
jgi:hypothetical protein